MMRQVRGVFRWAVILLPGSGVGMSSLGAQPGPPEPPLFASEAPVDLILVADFGALRGDRGAHPEERPARLVIPEPAGSTTERRLDIGIRTRGVTRLRRDVCRFPPLRLNIRTREAAGTLFEGQDKLKLVTHCRDRDDYEQYVLLEYLIYRMYRILTPDGFSVRLVRAGYVDVRHPADTLRRYAFLIEDDARLAERLGRPLLGDEIEVHQRDLDYENAVLFPVFQYMISNLDWSISARHNVKILGGDGELPVAVPYDFDMSGAVNARYAGPPDGVPVQHVRDRLFVSPCKNRFDLDPILQRFRDRRADIYRVYQETAALDADRRTDVLAYYDRFFAILEDDGAVDREFVRRCDR